MEPTINSFCATCCLAFSEALDQYDLLKHMFKNCDESQVLVHHDLAEYSIRHHKSFLALQEAARENCHLCSLIALYCTAFQVDSDLPVQLNLDLRDTLSRGYAFSVEKENSCTKIRLGLNHTNATALQQKAMTYYHPSGGAPEAIFDMLREWLHVCQDEHQECRRSSGGQMPARLIDVGISDSNTVQLIETDSILQEPYLTLSHCWGRDPQTYRRVTRGNLGVSLDMLPRTFRDAITVTRKLQFRYLWIDSLCIIQGDRDDWERESANMANIYANGILNLAASYSADGHGGLMMERNKLHVTPCHWTRPSRPISSDTRWGKWMKADEVCWGFNPQSEFSSVGIGRPLPLDSRAWVMQESLLSPRKVRFLPGEITWECKSLSTKESLHCGSESPAEQPTSNGGTPPPGSTHPRSEHLPGVVLHNAPKKQTTPEPKPSITIRPVAQSQLYSQWYKMVEEYTTKDLTWSDDRLPAIWALAQDIKNRTGDRYCSGLWGNDMLRGLLFRRYKQRFTCCRSQPSCSPSWSWAFTECEVKFEQFERVTRSYPTPNPLPDASIRKLDIVLTSSEPLSMGRTQRAELEIHSFVHKAECHRPEPEPSPSQKVARELEIQDELTVTSLDWDWYERLMKNKTADYRMSMTPSIITGPRSWLWGQRSHPRYLFSPVTECYYGWKGTKHVEELRWNMRQAQRRQQDHDKILLSDFLVLYFDTRELSQSYNGKVAICLHIKDSFGLIVETDGGSQTYRRIGTYNSSTPCTPDLWKRQIVRLG
ncbi:hypothetical protein CEP53_006027 [Fusarium sp. AF-6]|nr:hypothetical protein CEP53_006027 [Fusarium sp. AF-6]